jgi:hypothetical protein
MRSSPPEKYQGLFLIFLFWTRESGPEVVHNFFFVVNTEERN